MKVRRKILLKGSFFLILLLNTLLVKSQENIHKIRLIQDDRLEMLEQNASKIATNRPQRNYTKPTKQTKTRGYRIQIYSGNSRAEADDIRLKFMSSYPQSPCYIQFLSPYYKVRVGDYTSNDEANKQLKYFKRVYPMAFIVSSYISP